jgi:hypothetical protein
MMVYAAMSTQYIVKSEYEVQRSYADFVLMPLRDLTELNTHVFELKYLKKKEVPDPASLAGRQKIAEKVAEAEEQIRNYISAKEFLKEKTTAWVVIFAGETCVERRNVPL